MPSKAWNAELAAETIEILEQGWYQAADYTTVDIADLQLRAMQASTYHSPEANMQKPSPSANRHSNQRTQITVVNANCISVAHALTTAGLNTVVLNFASARNPGKLNCLVNLPEPFTSSQVAGFLEAPTRKRNASRAPAASTRAFVSTSASSTISMHPGPPKARTCCTVIG